MFLDAFFFAIFLNIFPVLLYPNAPASRRRGGMGMGRGSVVCS